MIKDDFKNIKSTKKDLRSFGFTVGVALLILGSIMWWLERGSFTALIWLSSALIITGILAPTILKPLQKIWMILAVLLGWIMTRLILVILFYVGFTPTHVLGKIFGKHFLNLKMGGKNSFWIKRENTEIIKESYEKQF